MGRFRSRRRAARSPALGARGACGPVWFDYASAPLDDFAPTASLAHLRRRAGVAAAVRGFFGAENYLEVDVPVLSADVVVDAHLEPLRTAVRRDPADRAAGTRRFLQTSPEFHLKRLVAAGSGSVWTLARVFRDGEVGPRHNPEFTLAEWYGVGPGRNSWRDQVAVTERLIRAMAEASVGRQPHERSTPLDPPGAHGADAPRSPFSMLTYDAAFARFAGTAVLDLAPPDLVALARDRGVTLPGGVENDRDGLLNVLLAELVEPHLGTAATGGPCFLCDYPASQAALAAIRRDPGRPPVAERFELYAGGVELANGYQELTDPAELRERIEGENAKRVAGGLAPLPAESRLLAAMEHGLPRCSGVALGFDRAVMWLLGETELAAVTAFPHAVA